MAAEALEQSMLESKDKEQLLAIAQALGIKTTARAAKATLIDKILETTSAGDGSRPRRAGALDERTCPEAGEGCGTGRSADRRGRCRGQQFGRVVCDARRDERG